MMLNAPMFETVPQAVDAINHAPRYLGVGVAPLVTGLAPDVIVVVGEITRAWNRVGPIINEVVTSRSLTHTSTLVAPTDPAGDPRLRGTIALALQKRFGAPSAA